MKDNESVAKNQFGKEKNNEKFNEKKKGRKQRNYSYQSDIDDNHGGKTSTEARKY